MVFWYHFRHDFFMKYTLILATNRLQLRPVELGDATFFLELMNTPKWLQYIGDRGIKNLEIAKKYIQDTILITTSSQTNTQYVIQLVDNLVPIGICGLYDRAGIEGKDLGFAFLPKYEGYGYATEAAQELLSFGFDVLNLTMISAITTKENKVAQKLLRNVGFVNQGGIILPTDKEELLLYRTAPSLRSS